MQPVARVLPDVGNIFCDWNTPVVCSIFLNHKTNNKLTMKNLKYVMALAMAVVLVIFAMTSRADDQKVQQPKPYPLDTCLVCDMKLGDMGKPYVFVYQGQEIKVCNESEKKDFDKDPHKYMKKLADAEAKLKK